MSHNVVQTLRQMINGKEYANINEGQVKHWSLNETTVCYEKKWNFLGEKNSEMRNAVKDVKHMINRCTK